MPVPVQTEGEAIAFFQGRLDHLIRLDFLWPLPLTREDSKGSRKDIVVDKSGI